MNKTGSIEDLALFVAAVFATGIVLFVMFYAVNTIMDKFATTSVTNSSESARIVWESQKELTHKYDYLVFGVFLALTLGLLTTAYLGGGNSMFMLFYFMGITILVIVASVITKVWAIISTTAPISTNLSYFLITNHLLSNFTIYTAVIGTMGIIAMFAKPAFGK